MDQISQIATTIVGQMQSATLAFLIGGVLLGALGSKLRIPDGAYQTVVLILLLKVGLGAGIAIKEAGIVSLIVPALAAAAVGVAIVLLGAVTLARLRGVNMADAFATVGLFGAVSASTLAAGMSVMDDGGVSYEGYIAALYPFMDLAALLTAVVLARMALARQAAPAGGTVAIGGTVGGSVGGPKIGGVDAKGILIDTLRSTAISALLLGLLIGLLAEPGRVYEGFYEPLFRGLLSLLMLAMGLEAWSRLKELKGVAWAYLAYGLTGPLVHGALGLGAGLILHETVGFSAGGMALLAVMAASSSDISGPPTMRGALPEANPSAYVGASTGLGTPVAILSIPLWIALAQALTA
ncbi:MAG: sodium-dependent bicarbonate transport family permease [Pseudomonadota bacterium]